MTSGGLVGLRPLGLFCGLKYSGISGSQFTNIAIIINQKFCLRKGYAKAARMLTNCAMNQVHMDYIHPIT